MFSIKKIFKKLQGTKTRSRSNQTKKTVFNTKGKELYSIDEQQLNNMLQKKISFDLFQIKSLNEEKPQALFPKAKVRTKEEIALELQSANLSQPIVLIGTGSQTFSQELRNKGFINVYFVKKPL